MIHRASVVLFVSILTFSAFGLDPAYFIDNNKSCFLTGLPPGEPSGTDFCTDFSSSSCCLPSFDLNVVQAAYYNTVPGGPGCGQTKHSVRAAYSAFRKFACLPCDPKEPLYRVQALAGDGSQVPPSPTASPSTFVWRVCRSFLYGRNKGASRRGLWGSNASHLSNCGLNINACQQFSVYNVTSQTFSSPDPNCTSTSVDLVIPAISFGASSDPALDLLTYINVPLNGFQIVIVDDEDSTFDFSKTPCFGSDVSAASAQQLLLALLVMVVQALVFAL